MTNSNKNTKKASIYHKGNISPSFTTKKIKEKENL